MGALVLDFKTGKPLKVINSDTNNIPDWFSCVRQVHKPVITKLHKRFNNGKSNTKIFLSRLKNAWRYTQLEPYILGCTHNCVWSLDKFHLELKNAWNKPFPIPSRVTYNSIEGILGKRVAQGSTDPLMWLDKKYRISYELIKSSKNKELTINTRSDLIVTNDYIEVLDKDKHTINIYYESTNDEINKVIAPGCPSFIRRKHAYSKLTLLGYKVNLVFVNFKNRRYEWNKPFEQFNGCEGHKTVNIELNSNQIDDFKRVLG